MDFHDGFLFARNLMAKFWGQGPESSADLQRRERPSNIFFGLIYNNSSNNNNNNNNNNSIYQYILNTVASIHFSHINDPWNSLDKAVGVGQDWFETRRQLRVLRRKYGECTTKIRRDDDDDDA